MPALMPTSRVLKQRGATRRRGSLPRVEQSPIRVRAT